MGTSYARAHWNHNSWKSNMADGRYLEKIEKSPYFSNGSTDLAKILHSDADLVSQTYQQERIYIFENPRWHFLSHRTFKIALFKIQNDRRRPCWKIEKSAYLSNRLHSLDELWHLYAELVSQAYQLLSNWIFENPRWRRSPTWKTVKSLYRHKRLTDFDEVWHDAVHWHFLCHWTFRIANFQN